MNRSWIALGGGLLSVLGLSLAGVKAAYSQAFRDHHWRCVRLEICPVYDDARPPEVDCYSPQPASGSSAIVTPKYDMSFYLTGYDAIYDMAVYGVGAHRGITEQHHALRSSAGASVAPVASPLGEHSTDEGCQPVDALTVTFLPFDGEPESIAEYHFLYGPAAGSGEVTQVPYRVYTAAARSVDGQPPVAPTSPVESATAADTAEDLPASEARGGGFNRPTQPELSAAEGVTRGTQPDCDAPANQGVSANQGHAPLTRLYMLAQQSWFRIRCRLTASGHEATVLFAQLVAELTAGDTRWPEVFRGKHGLWLTAPNGQQARANTAEETSLATSSLGPTERGTRDAALSNQDSIVEWYPWPAGDQDQVVLVGTSGAPRGSWRSLAKLAESSGPFVWGLISHVTEGTVNTIRSTPGCQALVTWLARSLSHSGHVLQNASVQLDQWIHSAAPCLPGEGRLGGY